MFINFHEHFKVKTSYIQKIRQTKQILIEWQLAVGSWERGNLEDK